MGEAPRPKEPGTPDEEASRLALPALSLPGFDRRRREDAASDPPPRARLSIPALTGRVAALLPGLVVGLVGVVLTYASLRGCELVRGTQTCGGPGLLVLVAILGLMVLLGSVVLGLLDLPQSRSTSFLAVVVLAVVLLLTPTDRLFSAWMLLAVPVVGAAAYVLASWVTTAFVEPRPEKGPEIDVR